MTDRGAGADVVAHDCLCDKILRYLGWGLLALFCGAAVLFSLAALVVGVWTGGGWGLVCAALLVVYAAGFALIGAVIYV